MIDALIQGFDEEVFGRFLNTKFSGSFSASRSAIPVKKDFAWESAEQLGIVKTLVGPHGANMPLLVVAVKLHDGETLRERSSRIKQFKFAKQVLDDAMSSPAPEVDGVLSQGLFVFYDEEGNFRLSLVFGKAEGTKLVWGTAKRLSFYVEAGQPNKTFRDRLALDWSSFDKLKEAFSVEKLTKEFYTRLFAWYQRAMDSDEVVFPNDIVKDKEPGEVKSEQIIRMITRLMFVWFLKQKHLVPNDLFDPEKLAGILKKFDAENGDDYYRAILQNLFFATLNTEISDREFAVEGNRKENEQHFGVKIFYRYASEFALSEEEVIQLFRTIPFMNGGLFECLDKDNHYYDGFSRRKSKRAQVPNAFFFDDKGLIPLLQQYNFTVEENSPGDEEVALDPEMLGKVFENLLAAYNPETNTQARKATGSFYTPREIVNYMVDESLVAYLKGKLEPRIDANERELAVAATDGRGARSTPAPTEDGEKSAIEKKLRLLFAGAEGNPFGKEETANLDESLVNAKILDPACGSGAFPMGILLRMVDLLRMLRNIPEDASVYDLKLELIKNCIYGGDIQCIAVQISKLRFFISLVCEQKPTKSAKDNYGIHTLPNLETKFVAANSLIGLPEAGKDVLELCTGDIAELKEQLFDVRLRHFSARSYPQKKQLRKEDRQIRAKIKRTVKRDAKPDRKHLELLTKEREKVAEPKWVAEKPKPQSDEMFTEFSEANESSQGRFDENAKKRKQLDTEIAREQKKVNLPTTEVDQIAEMLASWDPYDQNASASFSDSEWMFNVTDGFDVVIGNPPYVVVGSDDPHLATYGNDFYVARGGKKNLYKLFFEKGIVLLKNKGCLSYITPDNYLTSKDSIYLRRFFVENTNIRVIVHYTESDTVFEAVTQAVAVIVLVKEKNKGSFALERHQNQAVINMGDLSAENDYVFRGENSVIARMKVCPLRVCDVAEGYQGEINVSTKKQHFVQRSGSGRLPLIRGNQIQPYTFVSNAEWCPSHVSARNHHARERVVFQEVSNAGLLRRVKGMLLQNVLCGHTTNYLYSTNKAVNNSSLLAILNSSAVNYYFKYYNQTNHVPIGEIKRIPFPDIPEKVARQLAGTADLILAAKKADPNADTSAMEDEIDELVYDLYGLTPEEKEIVRECAVQRAEPNGRKAAKKAPAKKKTARKRKAKLPPSLPGWD